MKGRGEVNGLLPEGGKRVMIASFTPPQGPALNGIQLIALQMLIKFSSEIDIGFLVFQRFFIGWMDDRWWIMDMGREAHFRL